MGLSNTHLQSPLIHTRVSTENFILEKKISMFYQENTLLHWGSLTVNGNISEITFEIFEFFAPMWRNSWHLFMSFSPKTKKSKTTATLKRMCLSLSKFTNDIIM